MAHYACCIVESELGRNDSYVSYGCWGRDRTV